jgi:hypothetical protein
MKDAYEVLHQKEADLERIRREIESLTITASLLAEDDLSFFEPDRALEAQNKKPVKKTIPPHPQATGTEGKASIAPRATFWSAFKRRL